MTGYLAAIFSATVFMFWLHLTEVAGRIPHGRAAAPPIQACRQSAQTALGDQV
jgi:hypothetical protein